MPINRRCTRVDPNPRRMPERADDLVQQARTPDPRVVDGPPIHACITAIHASTGEVDTNIRPFQCPDPLARSQPIPLNDPPRSRPWRLTQDRDRMAFRMKVPRENPPDLPASTRNDDLHRYFRHGRSLTRRRRAGPTPRAHRARATTRLRHIGRAATTVDPSLTGLASHTADLRHRSPLARSSPEVTPPVATAASPQWTLPARCTSTLRAKSKQRSIGASIRVTVSNVTIAPPPSSPLRGNLNQLERRFAHWSHEG